MQLQQRQLRLLARFAQLLLQLLSALGSSDLLILQCFHTCSLVISGLLNLLHLGSLGRELLLQLLHLTEA